jgi:hypothetical protein
MRHQNSGAHRALPALKDAPVSVVVASAGDTDWTWRLLLTHVRSDAAIVDLVGDGIFVALAGGRGATLGSTALAPWSEGSPGGVVVDTTEGPLVCALDPDRRLAHAGADLEAQEAHRAIVERALAGASVPLGDALAIVVLDGVLTMTTDSHAFPFNPETERASRFDAVIADDGPAARLTVARDALIAVASLGQVG